MTGATTAVADGFDKPNGLAFAPDERCSTSATGRGSLDRPHRVEAFDVVGGRRLTAAGCSPSSTAGSPTGSRSTPPATSTSSAPAGVRSSSPDGRPARRIDLPGARQLHLRRRRTPSSTSPPTRPSGPPSPITQGALNPCHLARTRRRHRHRRRRRRHRRRRAGRRRDRRTASTSASSTPPARCSPCAARPAPRSPAPRVAVDKARTAAIFVRPSREMEEQVTHGRLGALALHGASASSAASR